MHIDLTDPGLFARAEFGAVLRWLREHDPVHWHKEPGGAGFWVVSRHRNAVAVYADHEVFSSRFGMRLGSDPDAVSAVSQQMLIVSDPPVHTHLKRVLGRYFGPVGQPHMERIVRQVVPEILEDVVGAGEVNFVDAARLIPNFVVCALMGIPRADWEWVGQTATDAFEGEGHARGAAHAEIFLYFEDLLEQRRARPGDDFLSGVAHYRPANGRSADDRALTSAEIVLNCNGILSGGNETTRYTAAGGVLALAEAPDQWRALCTDGRAAVPAAVEELLRWTTPGVHALRTATRPAQIAGTPISTGDRVTVWNASANWDEAVFDGPDRLDLSRTPNRHLTFGSGRHFCIGARLARLELAVFLAELTDRVERIELAGEPAYNASNFTWGLRSLPVRLVPRRSRGASAC